MSIEAMKQALEALGELNELSKGPSAVCLPAEIDTAMDALRQAIEQADMVEAWYDPTNNVVSTDKNDPRFTPLGQLWRLVQEREWVGLTDAEIKEIVGLWGDTPVKGYTRKLFDQIEAKLREKNNA